MVSQVDGSGTAWALTVGSLAGLTTGEPKNNVAPGMCKMGVTDGMTVPLTAPQLRRAFEEAGGWELPKTLGLPEPADGLQYRSPLDWPAPEVAGAEPTLEEEPPVLPEAVGIHNSPDEGTVDELEFGTVLEPVDEPKPVGLHMSV